MPNTSQVLPTIDVLSKYSSLVHESLGGDSMYIRAKETIQDLVNNGDIDDAKKAEIISSVIGGVVSSITNASMSTALEWSKYEKDLELKKLEFDQQLLILEQDKLLKTAQVNQAKTQTRSALIESKRMFGTGTFDASGVLINLANDGKVWNDMALVTQNTTNATKEAVLIDSKVKELEVAIHKIVADTYTNFGAFTFTYDASGNGIHSVTRNDITPVGNHISLSDTQQNIAVEQGKGYTYNAWANALTGSASVLGTALAAGSDVFTFAAGTNEAKLFDAVVLTVNNLKAASSNATGAVPVI